MVKMYLTQNKMTHFRQKKGKYVTCEKLGVRLTNKQFREGKKRFEEWETKADSKFKHMRSKEQKKKLPKYDLMEW